MRRVRRARRACWLTPSPIIHFAAKRAGAAVIVPRSGTRPSVSPELFDEGVRQFKQLVAKRRSGDSVEPGFALLTNLLEDTKSDQLVDFGARVFWRPLDALRELVGREPVRSLSCEIRQQLVESISTEEQAMP